MSRVGESVRNSEPISNFSVGIAELKTSDLWKGVIGEFLAMTCFLLCTISTAGGAASDASILRIAFTFGFAIAVLVQAVGRVSGGHINSAVSFGLMLSGRCSVIRCILYTIAQCLGSIAGVAIANGTMGEGFGNGVCSYSVGTGWALLLEAVFTGILVFVVLSLTDAKYPSSNVNLPLNIGLAVFLSHLILVPLTGSAINPTRALGSAVIAKSYDDLWLYWVAGYIGSGISTIIYFCLSFTVEDGDEDEKRAVNDSA